MSPTPQISPEVQGMSRIMNEERIQERTSLKFYRNFWDSYKGHVRGLLTGVAIGSMIGASIGLAVTAFLPGTILISLATATAGGALIGAKTFGEIGTSSASRASGLAEKHARLLDAAYKGNALKAIDDKLMYDGAGHHYEFPRSRDKGKIFSPKSGLVGAGIGSLTGAVLGWAGSGVIAGIPVISHLMALPALAALGPVALGAIAIGVFGLTFGIERSVFKTIFNQTDANIQGNIHNGRRGPDLGRLQTTGKETDAELLAHRLRRQEEIQYLEKDYNNKIFWGAASGVFRGFAGGAATGAIIGAVSGLVALGVVALAGASTAGLLIPLVVIFSGAGALLGMEVFSEAGREAGAESTARAIDNEFEHNRILHEQGTATCVPPTVKKPWFNPQAAVIMGLAGAAVGVPLAPIMGFGLGAAGYATSALTTGMIGAGFGLGTPIWKSIGNVTNWIYEKSYFSNPTEQNIPSQNISAPAVARSAQVTPTVAFKAGTINTLVSPIGSYAGKPAGQHLRSIAEQQFKNMQSSQGATIN